MEYKTSTTIILSNKKIYTKNKSKKINPKKNQKINPKTKNQKPKK